MSARVRVFVVDAHPLFRRGLRELFAAASRTTPAAVDLAGEAATVAAAAQLLELVRADVLVIGDALPDGAGVDVVRAARQRQTAARSILLGSAAGRAAVSEALDAGAAGYLLRTVGERDLLEAVRTVAAGRFALDPALAPAMVGWVTGRADPGGWHAPLTAPSLTDRQQRILGLIGQGLSNRQIGARLGIAEKTVKNHVTELLRRLGLSSRTEAALFFSSRAAPAAIP